MTLALKYRPVRFADVSGQAHVRVVLQAIVRSGDVPSAFLFQGPRGTGKTSMGRILAAALNCESPDDGDACGRCASCIAVQQGTSTAVMEIDAASHGLVDDIRRLRELVTFSHAHDWRVVLLDEAQSMSREAFNALLKVLEEPPEGVVFVLLTTEVQKIPDTVRSRAMTFEFRRLTERHLTDRLRHIAEAEGFEVSDEVLTLIARQARGGLRDAVMLMDQASRVGAFAEQAFRKLYVVEDVAPLVIGAACSSNPAQGMDVLDDWFLRNGDATILFDGLVGFLRDLFVFQQTEQTHRTGIERDLLERLAGALEPAMLVRIIRLLWAGQIRIRDRGIDPRATMEMLYIQIRDVVRPEVPIQQAKAQQGSQRLTLSEMVEMTDV